MEIPASMRDKGGGGMEMDGGRGEKGDRRVRGGEETGVYSCP